MRSITARSFVAFVNYLRLSPEFHLSGPVSIGRVEHQYDKSLFTSWTVH